MCARRAARTACLAAILALAGAAWGAGDEEYIHEDARISGKEIHGFTEGEEQISVILGDFQLTMGKRVIRGRDAVVWIRSVKAGSVVRNEMTIYIEGDASITEPNGVTTSDTKMLVTLRHDGRIQASGAYSARSLSNFPLYKRAYAARLQEHRRAYEKGEATTQPAVELGPPLVITGQPPRRDEARRPATTQPAAATQPAATQPVVPRQIHPVNFHADSFSSELRGDVRVTIARGNVYLSQGDPDSDAFLELRSQAAVVYSRKIAAGAEPPPKESRSPLSPKVRPDAREIVLGAYLEGDVVIARGARYLRGPEAYYDFTTDRAIVTNAVFRTVQEQRNIPIYVRADEARVLSSREMYFRNAKVSTSDFYTPSYHVGAKQVYLRDQAPYDPETGEALGPPNWHADLRNTTYNIAGVPILWSPRVTGDFEQGHTALRKVKVGRDGSYGTGVETQWNFFRLLGMLEPQGVDSYLDFNWFNKSTVLGLETDYDRRNYSGYSLLYGVHDREGEDDFGDRREDIPAPKERGRATFRHKQFLPDDWELQFELSYICDKNFMEKYFPEEFFAGKEQETLAYAKKQRDNGAVTGLLQYRMNRFDTQTESAPDVGFFLLGQPLWEDRLTFFSESRAGLKRWRPAKDAGISDSDFMFRGDTREELALPLHLGPVNVVPYAVGRATYWGDRPEEGEYARPYGQIGARANLHIWRVYENARSRLLDVNRLKHVITPEAGFFLGCTDVQPDRLFPMEPGVEEYLPRMSGVTFGVRQRLQTQRGAQDADKLLRPQTVDWMRLDLFVSLFDTEYDTVPSDGRYFWSRPEYSLGRNNVSADYEWQISDSTALLADMNYDIDRGILARSSLGFDVTRDPRLSYYLGVRTLHDVDSSVGTFLVRYKLTEKYSLMFAEQYDFDFDSGKNLYTVFGITRKLERWYVSFSLSYDQTEDDLSVLLTLWPEGVPEFRVGGGRMSLLSRSSRN